MSTIYNVPLIKNLCYFFFINHKGLENNESIKKKYYIVNKNFYLSRPSHLLDEDSQSSVKSSTNESNKLKKSKFADLFDRYVENTVKYFLF